MTRKNNKHFYLTKLAKLLGIQLSYITANKKRQTATQESLIKIINALGFKLTSVEDAERVITEYVQQKKTEKIEPVIICESGKIQFEIYLTQNETNQIACKILLEDQAELEPSFSIHENDNPNVKTILIETKLPIGYHQLFLTVNEKQFSSLLISPYKTLYPKTVKLNQPKRYGFFVPIYALHSSTTNLCGDLKDFQHFINWLKEFGASVVSTLPLHAVFLSEPFEPSPYSPASRFFWNELYLDLQSISEAYRVPYHPIHFNSKYLDYKDIAQQKRQQIETLIQACFQNDKHKNEFENFIQSHPELHSYAIFRAKCEQFGPHWHEWPFQDEGQFNLNHSLYRYHAFVQWHLHLQITKLKQYTSSMDVFLYFDMPVGVHQNSYDVWRFSDEFVSNVSMGAPPDAVFKDGQLWNNPPLHPIKIRYFHYRYFIQSLRAILPFMDILRLDHVMSLNRLFFIPKDAKCADGVFVQYRFDEIYAILSIESHRHQVAIVGENLGTVPKIVNQLMKKYRMLSMYVLQYELDSDHILNAKKIPKYAVASLNTHDMPTFSAYFQSLDITERLSLGLLQQNQINAEMNKRKENLYQLQKILRHSGFIYNIDIDFTSKILLASLMFLATSSAQILIINIEDIFLETESQNIPTLPGKKNWRHRLRYSIEEFNTIDNLQMILTYMKRVRQIVGFSVSHKKSITSLPDIDHQLSLFTKDDLYLFNEGNHFRLYEKLGAHIGLQKNIAGVYFSIWAPNAKYVSVLGEFNDWNPKSHPLHPLGSSGIWEIFIANLESSVLYKFHIESHYHHYIAEKYDPFEFYQEVPPNSASIVWDLNYCWQDQQWMQNRRIYQNVHAPISIYEVHIGSWRRVPEENFRTLSYREIAPILTDYVLKMGYTHVEFLPIMEHPFYGSWGYQTIGYFAPTARFGTPQDFMYLIDYLHQHNIGVILDWVPSHFPYDQHALAFFDGSHLYEHSDPKLGYHPDWRSAIFNYGRNEVHAFLISSALFWLDKYHVDGLRVDAVASMLYLDYSRQQGEWIPNEYGGRENLAAIRFLRDLNAAIYHYYPDVQTFAEESTAWGGVSRPTYTGGLGFGFKWDMGWMHDTLRYLHLDPIYRKHHHGELSFRMLYAFHENFVLSLSHDEVVHGKSSLLAKMPGTDWDKFANLRLLFGYQFTIPGKKLLFMGNDFGQWREWNHDESLDWHLLEYKPHQELQRWVRKLNQLYSNERALHEFDCEPQGFEWIDCNDSDHSIYIFLRKASNEEKILVIVNATPMLWKNYRIGVPVSGNWLQIANSDSEEFGGSGNDEIDLVTTENIDFHGQHQSFVLNISPISVMIYKWQST